MSCSSCHLDLRTTSFIQCSECSVPSITLCILCFSGKFESVVHKHNHAYYVLSGENLDSTCMNTLAMGNNLILLDSCRKYSVGSWDEVSTRSKISPVTECENKFMSMYSLWSKICNDDFPKQEYALECKALDGFSTPNSEGMYIESVKLPKIASDLPGFMANRVDFEIEYDDSAELIIADLELCEDDTQEERKVKMDCLKAYTERALRRESIKEFVISEGLTSIQHQLDNHRTRTTEEVQVRGKLRPVERFFNGLTEFESFVQMTLYERRLQSRLAHLRNTVKSVDQQSVGEAKSEPMSVDMDDNDKPLTRSKAAVESNKKSKFTEAECNKITEITVDESMRGSLAKDLNLEEQDLINHLQIQPDSFAILRDTLLGKLVREGFNHADVTLAQLGGTVKVDIVGSRSSPGTMKLE